MKKLDEDVKVSRKWLIDENFWIHGGQGKFSVWKEGDEKLSNFCSFRSVLKPSYQVSQQVLDMNLA